MNRPVLPVSLTGTDPALGAGVRSGPQEEAHWGLVTEGHWGPVPAEPRAQAQHSGPVESRQCHPEAGPDRSTCTLRCHTEPEHRGLLLVLLVPGRSGRQPMCPSLATPQLLVLVLVRQLPRYHLHQRSRTYTSIGTRRLHSSSVLSAVLPPTRSAVLRPAVVLLAVELPVPVPVQPLERQLEAVPERLLQPELVPAVVLLAVELPVAVGLPPVVVVPLEAVLLGSLPVTARPYWPARRPRRRSLPQTTQLPTHTGSSPEARHTGWSEAPRRLPVLSESR